MRKCFKLQNVLFSTWEDAKFEPQLVTNVIQHSMYVRPRKIQANSIPIILEGIIFLKFLLRTYH